MGWAIAILCGVLGALIYSNYLKGTANTEEALDQIKMDKKDMQVNPGLRKINTYFFENNMFSFEKFCDYVICIREEMSLSEVADCLMELDMMTKCSGDLSERVLSVLIYSEGIIEISHRDFEEMKKAIGDKRFKGTYQDMTFILITTIFYLKSLLLKKKGILQ